MNEFQKQIGDIFKKKREEMSLTLKEVENATSIRIIYLNAIEQGNMDDHLSPVYALGFVKQYASFLGLDGERILQENPKAYTKKLGKQEFDYGIGTLEVRNPQASPAKSRPQIAWIAIGAVVVIAAWFFARAIGLF